MGVKGFSEFPPYGMVWSWGFAVEVGLGAFSLPLKKSIHTDESIKT
jgi:hypothetical protein